MLLYKKFFKVFLLLSLCTAWACSSVKMADIPATADPREEVSKLASEINTAVTKNVDVLAADQFQKSKSYLAEAQRGIKDGKSQSKILDSLRAGNGYLTEAYAIASTRQGQAEGLLAARQMALQAGAASFTELKSDLEDLDEEVSERADDLADTKTEKIAKYEAQYVDLEKRAVILSQLGKIQAVVNGAEKNDAKSKVPNTFKKAEMSLKTAESIISTNVRNPAGYQDAVKTARADAKQLSNVLATIEQNGGNLEESVAIKMVAQNKKISGLESSVGEVAIQKALEEARSQFSTDEADAYQQGENLVIRLKQINFASGRSDLPESALPLLAKVSGVAKSLNTSQIKVEGHTDSVGPALQNEALSENRASAVATYFKTNGFSDIQVESEGYGYKKPIASNKSKEGRAQNRRVDIVISPSSITE
jgi:OmpA-OmpF porin, OOP family